MLPLILLFWTLFTLLTTLVEHVIFPSLSFVDKYKTMLSAGVTWYLFLAPCLAVIFRVFPSLPFNVLGFALLRIWIDRYELSRLLISSILGVFFQFLSGFAFLAFLRYLGVYI